MRRLATKCKETWRHLLKQKGQGLTEFVLILAFCAAIGWAASEVGFMDTIGAVFDSGKQPETVTAAIGGGGKTNTPSNPTDPTDTTDPSTPPTPPTQTDPTEPTEPTVPTVQPTTSGTQTGGTLAETLDATLQARAVENGTTGSYTLGAIVNDNGTYKIVVNGSETDKWHDLREYHIIDVSEHLTTDGNNIKDINAGDIVITENGEVYFHRWGSGQTSYPPNVNENWVKIDL